MMLKGDILIIAIIHVINSQSFDVIVQNATVALGEDASINFSYSISGGSLLTWVWFKSTSKGYRLNDLISFDTTVAPDSRYSVDTSQVGIITLIIANTSKSDEGFYLCVASSGLINDSDVGSLTVQFIERVTINIISPVIEGDSVTFLCSANSNPVSTIILYKEETEVTSETTTNLIYNIKNVTRSDGGNYRCEAINSAGNGTSQIKELDVQFIERVTIDIASPVIEGDSGIILCFVNDANPVATIILYKEETEVTRRTNLIIYDINSVTRSDGGNYRCEAMNRAGSSTSQIKELDVQYAPEFVDNINVAPGEIVVIEPDVSANPNNITYTWTTDPPGIDDIDTNPATFTFIASEVVGTSYIVTVNAINTIESATKSVKVTVSSVDYCVCSPCGNEGTCIPVNFGFTCECKPGYSGRYCENEASTCSSCTNLTIGMFFVGIFVGAFGVIAGFISYTKIKQKAQQDKRSTDKRKQDTYMDYMADRPTVGNENQTYEDLQHREEETAYVNVKPGKR